MEKCFQPICSSKKLLLLNLFAFCYHVCNTYTFGPYSYLTHDCSGGLVSFSNRCQLGGFNNRCQLILNNIKW